ncbi:MAG: hypothetical protein JST04_11245 [Bdellovibrionales bacterium]|nr:hypothetical protein [Bdellovibrionales bacterium]
MAPLAELRPIATRAWGVLALFLIPVGGGIPAGVLLARDQGFAWPVTTALYFLSDVILASVLEPTILFLLALSARSKRFSRLNLAAKQAMEKTAARYAKNPRPLALVMISFGVDPMTGRMATAIAGHGFLTGWLLAILGDMIYFAMLMVSTLWLDGILGDGTATTLIIMAAMFGIPWIYRKIRGERT